MLRILTLAAALSLAAGTVVAQEKAPETGAKEEAKQTTGLKVGDKAPALEVEKFLKGAPVTGFEKGKVYVVEFWATWCGPCIQSMPHISHVQSEFKDRGVTVIGVNIWEDAHGGSYTKDTLTEVTKFVGDQGDRMGYTVAFDGGSKKMAKNYMEAAGQGGIPCSFVIDGEGKVAWIGHPMWLDTVVDGVSAGKWSAKEGEAKIEEAEKTLQSIFRDARSKPKDALASWEKFEKDFPGAAGSMDSAKFFLLSAAGETEKLNKFITTKVDEAIKYKDSASLNALAWNIVDPDSQLKQADYNVALRAATKANEFSGDKDPAILDTLAHAYFRTGDKAKAVATATRAVELASKNEKYAEMLGDLQKSLDTFKAAK